MEEFWEENDFISKHLNKEIHNDQSEDELSECLFKSLHQEFIEVGEDYEIPQKMIYQDVQKKCNVTKEVVDDELKIKQNTSTFKEEVDLRRNLLQPVQSEVKVTKKMVRPPPGFLPKSKVAEKTNSVVKVPPPGFHKKTNLKIPPGLNLKNFAMNKTNPVRPPPGFKLENSKKPKTFSTIINEFDSLSCIMDKELQTYKMNIINMKEQKQCYQENLKDVGRVDILKTLLYEQQNQIKSMEKQHQQEIQELKRQLSEANKKKKKKNDEPKSNKDLQMEFNKVLNEREEEIDNLNAMIHDLQFELESYQGGSDDIAMEVTIFLFQSSSFLFLLKCLVDRSKVRLISIFFQRFVFLNEFRFFKE